MSGRTTAEHNVAQETNERSTELNNKAKWLDSLKSTASQSMRAIYAEHTPAVKAINTELFALMRPNPQTGDFELPNDPGSEEFGRLLKALSEAQSLLLGLKDHTDSMESDWEFIKNVDAWLKAEREKAVEAMGETHANANAHVENGVLEFARRCL